ncbi:MAG: adenylate/guanylate cyclase domain-containing protein [Marmoricola sp.]
MSTAGDEVRCDNCQEVLPGKARFCLECGAPVTAKAETEARKTVTLLFCDVSGSTALGEELDPEAYRGIMSRYFEVARTAVERHGGTVEKFVGDAVLAVFGVPELREDDALRAVRAAAELSEALRDLSEELTRTVGASLEVRTGVNTGAVVTGAARAGGSFATGDAVNTAARLEQAAAPGEVLIGASTWSLVRDAVEVEAVPPLTVKGKADPLPAYRLLRMLDVDQGRTRRLHAELVGRDREIRALDDAFAGTVEGRRSHLVTVLGSAGVGKTRLVAQFLDGLGADTTVLNGRCVSYGQGITFFPVVQLLREAAALTGAETQEETTQALLAVMSGHPDAKPVADWLLPLLGRGGEPGSAEETFWAVRSMLEHLAGLRPLVVTLDDLHWAEPTLLDMVERLREELRDLPLLLVCKSRPELLEERPGWGGGALNSTTFLLEPLTGRHTAALLAGLLGSGVPDEVVAAVDGWAGGNPLFVEEVATHLIEERVLLRTPAGWEVSWDLADVSVPPTVTALLTARLDRLPRSERSLLERTSVIGLEFGADEALALSEGAADVTELLGSLGRRDLLRRCRAKGSDTWAFRHILVREAAYESLPKAVRAELHEQFADRLDAGGANAGGETHAFVGHHLEQAVHYRRSLSTWADGEVELAARAARALARAAGHARDIDDLTAADTLLQRAIAIAPAENAGQRELLWRLAQVQNDQGRMADALQTLDQVSALLDDTAGELERAALLAQLLTMRSNVAEVVDPAEIRTAAAAAAELARTDGDLSRLGQALECGYTAAMMQAQWGEVERLAREVLAVAPVHDRRTARLQLLGAQFWGERPYPEGLATVVEIRLQPGQSERDDVMNRSVEAAFRAGLGELVRARELHEEAEQQTAPTDPFVRFITAFTFLQVYIADGDHPRAQRLLRGGCEASRESGYFAILSTLAVWRCALLLEHGDPDDEAGAVLEEAARHTSAYDAMSVSLVATCRAVLASRAGDHERAQAEMTASLAAVDSTDQLVQRADARRWLSEVARRGDDVDGERRLLLEALDLYRRKGHVPLTSLTERKLAEL